MGESGRNRVGNKINVLWRKKSRNQETRISGGLFVWMLKSVRIRMKQCRMTVIHMLALSKNERSELGES